MEAVVMRVVIVEVIRLNIDRMFLLPSDISGLRLLFMLVLIGPAMIRQVDLSVRPCS